MLMSFRRPVRSGARLSEHSTDAAANEAEFQRRIFITNVYALLALLSLSVFGTLQIIAENNPVLGSLELAGASAVAFIVMGLKLTKNVSLTRMCLLLVILVFMVVMLTTGGTEGTGIFWLFMFPVAAFFLAGKRQGLYWMGVLFATVITMWLAGRSGLVSYYYTDIETRQVLFALFVVAIALYVYQRSRESWEEEARRSQKSLRQYLQRMTTLYEKVDLAKNEFMSLTSHQLRTPISAIGWYSEMLLSGDIGKLVPDQAEYIRHIYNSNIRLGEIVDAMLMVSSLELGEVYIMPKPTDLHSLAHKLFEAELKKFPDKQFVVHEQYDALPKLTLDPTVVKHILRNLFSNAMKYTPTGGTITVSIARSDHRLSKDSQGSVAITIRDTGYGIPLKDQENTFAKLFRAANIKVKDTDGTGLGLYIVKALLDLVGGRISFASEENKGSSFVVELPLEGMVASKHAASGEST